MMASPGSGSDGSVRVPAVVVVREVVEMVVVVVDSMRARSTASTPVCGPPLRRPVRPAVQRRRQWRRQLWWPHGRGGCCWAAGGRVHCVARASRAACPLRHPPAPSASGGSVSVPGADVVVVVVVAVVMVVVVAGSGVLEVGVGPRGVGFCPGLRAACPLRQPPAPSASGGSVSVPGADVFVVVVVAVAMVVVAGSRVHEVGVGPRVAELSEPPRRSAHSTRGRRRPAATARACLATSSMSWRWCGGSCGSRLW